MRVAETVANKFGVNTETVDKDIENIDKWL
ncbi:hypothetical protein HAPAU_30180 [Halalkalicoccus paucihalophilus]|uniref:Uncharacterized protein n=1 Tax=Halalkalicoccus paucihalophilus TaxID=1008153 RepID=A0A151AB45_9EURY|nr:hypothetical protein HAPAU_30180 [Halalkalicoccus paucihalophilus]